MASSSQDEDEGLSHLIECTGKGQNGKGCVAWILFSSQKIPKRFMNPSFLRGFCTVSEVSELREKQSQDPEQSPITGDFSSLLNSDSNLQCWTEDNIRKLGVKDDADKDVYQKVVDIATNVRHQILKTDIDICHLIPSRCLKKEEMRPIIVKIGRGQTKSGLMVDRKSLEDC